MKTTEVTPEQLAELNRFETRVVDSDGHAILTRWESGRYLNSLKDGKGRLPRGVLGQWSQEQELGKSEIYARMKFATKYQIEAELSDVVGKFGSWTRIVHEALTDKPRQKSDEADTGDSGNRTLAELQKVSEGTGSTDQAVHGWWVD